MHFKPDECVHTVTLGESTNQVLLVFSNALNQVGGDAHIERAVSAAGENIDARLLAHTWKLLNSGSRRNDDNFML